MVSLASILQRKSVRQEVAETREIIAKLRENCPAEASKLETEMDSILENRRVLLYAARSCNGSNYDHKMNRDIMNELVNTDNDLYEVQLLLRQAVAPQHSS